MNRKYQFLLVLFILLDTAYSFYQHFHVPLDGDMAAIIWPAEWYTQVLEDPFGISVITEGQRYSGTNRFFAHWSLAMYYKTVPLFLQHFVSPIDSVYLAGALAKTLIQLMLLGLLSAYITASRILPEKCFLLVFALLVPLFQTMGYNHYLGILAKSITYTFFYALPLALLMLFFLPFFRALLSRQEIRLNIFWKAILLLLAFILPFQGPLNPAVILIVCPAIILFYWLTGWKQTLQGNLFQKAVSAFFKIPAPVLVSFLPAMFISLYSLYIGSFNSENLPSAIGLGERYLRLLPGLFALFTGKLGYPLLLLMLLVNILLLRKNGPGGQVVLQILKWILIIAGIYLLLLPLGGYRSYRPNIIRGDTFIPVALALFYFYGLSTLFLLKEARFRNKKYYVAGVMLFLLAFTNADRPLFEPYNCEHRALETLAVASQETIKFTETCNVMSWEPIREPGQSRLNGWLLAYWNITPEPKRYYYSPE